LTVTPKGNRRFYAIAPAGVQDLRTYLDSLWDDALAAFADAAQRQSQGER
jgi:hypothetical protein